MAPQPPLAPPLVSGGVPVLGHLLDFIKGPVGMIDALRSQYRSMFTIRVGPQRITFMIGAGPQLQFIKAKDEVLDQAPVYGFTIPVFGEGIVYDSPLDERQQQVMAARFAPRVTCNGDVPRVTCDVPRAACEVQLRRAAVSEGPAPLLGRPRVLLHLLLRPHHLHCPLHLLPPTCAFTGEAAGALDEHQRPRGDGAQDDR